MAFDAELFLDYFGFERIKNHDEYNVMASCFQSEMHSNDDRKRSFGILKKPRRNPDGTVTPAGTANCYVCGGWSLEQLTKDLLNRQAELKGISKRYDEFDALKFLEEKGWLPDEDSIDDLRREFENMEGFEFKDTLEEFKEENNYFPDSILDEYKKSLHKKTLQRGNTPNAISVDMARFFELGYDKQTQRIIIPVRDKNKGLVGVVSRATREDDFIRYGIGTINPEWLLAEIQNKHFDGDKMLYVFDKRYYVFGEHLWYTYQNGKRVLKHDKILVLESPLDVVYAWSQGLQNYMNIGAVFGSKVTKEQMDKIAEHYYVIEALDNDKGGKEGREHFHHYMSKRNVDLYTCDFWGKKDLGECTPDEVKSIVSRFKKFEETLFNDIQPME